MNIEIQKKIKERQNKKQKQSMRGQASTEYPMMMIIALILIALAFVVILAIGGKTAKSGTLHAELLSAETSGATLSIATNLPLTFKSGTIAGNVVVNGVSNTITVSGETAYNVSGGYEYALTLGAGISGSISSISLPGATGTILLLPASGANITTTTGIAPFTITNLGS